MRVRATIAFCLVATLALGGWELGQGMNLKSPGRTRILRLRPGHEVAVVLIGSTQCAASKDSAFRAAFGKLRATVKVRADQHKASFATIGVATDWDIREGLSFLDAFGSFDEIIVGKSWLNTGYDKYVRDVKGREGVPQVVIVSRQVVMHDSVVSLSDEATLASLRGKQAILDWLSAGGPLPLSSIKPTDASPAKGS